MRLGRVARPWAVDAEPCTQAVGERRCVPRIGRTGAAVARYPVTSPHPEAARDPYPENPLTDWSHGPLRQATETFSFDSSELKNPLRDAVLGAVWTWRGVVTGRL
ncbi:hypothetical protein [Streptomyces fagopyri]|uniref:hypothetical protein n=1 Tax=Streptomyces fagopyri TaxID=2662397 RepID=UPI0037246C4F